MVCIFALTKIIQPIKNFKYTNNLGSRGMKDNELLNELLLKQLKNVPITKKLRYNDLRRLRNYFDSSIFDENKCCLWNGYITNEHNANKGIYINFFFKSKKVALHRLLYINFVDELLDNEYLKFTCENKGKCCNIMHLKKFTYANKKTPEIQKENTAPITKPAPKSLTLSFD
jgi:hypothetical protein